MANDINIRIGAKLDGLQRGIKKAQGQLSRFANFAESVGTQLSTRLTLPIVGAGAAAVSQFAKFERLELGLKALAGEGENAAETMARLQEIAKLPGIGLEQLIGGVSQLRTVGFEAKQAEAILIGLSKAVTLSGRGPAELQAVVRQLTQINSKGRILEEDLGVIKEQVPSIGFALQDAFGTTSVEAIRESGISTQQFTAELIKAIESGEQFQKAQGGLANEIDNFGQSVRIALAQLGKTIAESINLSGILQQLSGFVERVTTGFQNLSPGTQKFIVIAAGAAAAIGPLLLGFGAVVKAGVGVVSAIQLINGTLLALAANPIVLAIAGIVALTAAVITAYKRSETFRNTVDAVAQNLRQVFAPVIAGMVSLFNSLREGLTVNQEGFRKFLAVVSGVMTAALEFINIFFEGVKAGAAGFSLLLEGEFRAAGSKFAEAIQKTNPISAAITEGKRLGSAYRNAYEEALQVSTIEAPQVSAGSSGAQSPDLNAVFAGLSQGAAAGSADSGSAITERALKAARDFQGIVSPLVESAAIPLVEQTTNITRALDKAIETAPVFRDSLVEAALAIKEGFGPTLLDGFQRLGNEIERIAESGALSFKTFAQAAVSSISEVIGALIKQGVAAAVANAFKNPAGVIPPVGLALAALAGAGASALFKGIISGIAPPKLAAGGIIPPGYEGDRFPAMLNSGEAVIPLQKLFNVLGNSGGQGEFILRGQDLYLAMNRAERSYNRTGG